MRKKIRTAIIGCGGIAGGYDEQKKGEGIFSHAGAYTAHTDVEISAAFDVDPGRLSDFCQYWSVGKPCRSLESLLDGDYEIVSVCTPDDTHESVLNKIIDRKAAKYIWTEKPLTLTGPSAGMIIEKARGQGIGLWLSNQRRWEPEHQKICRELNKGLIGEPLHAAVYYVKGITHIGCTAVNTCRFLMGEIAWVRAFPPFHAGSFQNDPSLRALAGFQSGATAVFMGCDKEEYVYSLFELDIVGTHGRIKIGENGDLIRIFSAKAYDHYEGFSELKEIRSIRTEMIWSMKYGFDLLSGCLAEGRVEFDSAEEGRLDLTVIDAVKESARKGGELIRLT